MTKQYELLVIGDQEVEESQFIDDVSAVLLDHAAEINKKSVWGLRTLAYPIKKKNQGRYILFEFESKSPKQIEEIVKGLRIIEAILRFSVVSVKSK
ncbi:30S ribosomal protein S6 [bacterium]|nr:30S ribosomal protein S6 [bacterium]